MGQFVSPFALLGLQLRVSPLFSNSYVAALYAGSHSRIIYAGAGYLRRIVALTQAQRYDALWIEKEALPYLPGWAAALRACARPYVLDFDDAVFHNYEKPSLNPLIKVSYKSLLEAVRQAALVISGNPYISLWATEAGARVVEEVPTVVDLTRYPRPSDQSHIRQRIYVGWIGTPTTVRYIASIASALRRLSRDVPIRVVLVGAQAPFLPDVDVDYFPWTEDTEAAAIANFDIGIMPLENGPLQRGKCGYKLIQYMACSKPTVASPVGVNSTIVEHGRTGFLADSENDWYMALRSLCESPALRYAMGVAGRRKVEQGYSLQSTVPRLAGLFQRYLV